MIYILTLIIIFLYLIKPNLKRKEEVEKFEKYYYAHRGYFNNISIIENTILAFENAIKNNFGIELDVTMTKDNYLIVFHDNNLKRMCGIDKLISECTLKEINQYSLLKTNQKIPLFEDVLKVINGRVPIIVEIKPEGNYIKTSQITHELLKNYNGLYCIESFNPLIISFFKKNYPNIIRGKLSTKFNNSPYIRNFILTNLLLNFMAKPDFIAYEYKHSNNLSLKIIQYLYKGKTVTYTIQNKKELSNASQYDIVIFDSFNPIAH